MVGGVGRSLLLARYARRWQVSRGSVWGLSRMQLAVRLEKMFCSWGLLSENVGHEDPEKQRVRAKCRPL